MRHTVLTLAAVGVFTLAVAACDDTQTDDAGTTAPASPSAEATTSASPSDGIVTSEEVTLEGMVSMELADRVFLLTDPVIAEGTSPDLGSEIVVVVTGGDAVSIEQDEQVLVTGTLNAAEVGDELTWIEDQLNVELPEAIASVISGTQLLLADSVQPQ